MDVILEKSKTTITLVKWNVGLPRVNTSIETKSFQIFGFNWNLKLSTRLNTQSYGAFHDEVWDMSLYNTESKPFPLFLLRVYIQNRGKYIYLTQKEINSGNTVIWNFRNSDFRRLYPNIQIVGTTLQFVLDFHSEMPDLPIKVNRSIQTTKPIPCTSCSEEHACLQNLSLDLCKLVGDGSDPDVKLKSGDFTMGAHKLILGARSEVFRNMLKSDMMEGREGFVEIIDMEPKILEVFIKYIYTGILPELTAHTALPLYEAADKYQVEALKKRSGCFLVKNVSPENALTILATFDAHSDDDLKESIVSYVLEQKIPSKEAEWLKFCNLYPKLAIEVLNRSYKLSSGL